MPGPRRARKRATVLSSPMGETSSTRPPPSTSDAASTFCPRIVPRPSSCASKRRRYVSTASSRSVTAIPTWWMPRACTRPMLLVGARRKQLDGADGLARVRLCLDVDQQREQLVPLERLLLELVRGTVRDPPEDDELRGPPAEDDLHLVDQLLARVEIAVLAGQVERVA